MKKITLLLLICNFVAIYTFAQLIWAGEQNLVDGQVISQNITLNGDVTINISSGTAIINGVINGGYNISKTGQGKIILTGENNYTGTTAVTNGILQVGNGTTGSIDKTSNVVLNNIDAIFRFEPGGYGMTFSKIISGVGGVEYSGDYSRILVFTANHTYTGTTSIENGLLILGDYAAPTGSVSGDIVVASGAAVNFCRPDDYTYSGVISGEGSVVCQMDKKLILTGNNTYTGNTIITTGTIVLGTTGSIESSADILFFNSGTKFDVSKGNKKIKKIDYNGYSSAEVLLGSSTLTIDVDDEEYNFCSFYGTFSGIGNVLKKGTGILELGSDENNATGTFTLVEGMVRLKEKWAGDFYQETGTTLEILKNNVSNTTIDGNFFLAGGTVVMNLNPNNPNLAPPKLSVKGAVSVAGVTTLNISSYFTVTNYVLMEAASGIDSISDFILNVLPGFKTTLTATGTQLLLTVQTIPVTDIINVPTTAIVDIPCSLTGIVVPSNATNQTIVWSVQDSGTTGATIYGNTFYAMTSGIAIVRATIVDGLAIDTNYTQDFEITVINVGVKELTTIGINIYPNPTDGELRINSGELKIRNVVFFDIYGRNIGANKQIYSEKEIVTNISHLSAGVYFVRILTETGEVIKKVLKE